MRVIFIGCVEFSAQALQTLLGCGGIEICGVVTRSRSSANADFRSLEHIAAKHGVPFFLADEPDPEDMAAWIQKHQPDICFCIGWSMLLPKQILDIPKHGVVGYHPALLPRNRGRHPIIWALALGLETTGSTFFLMDEGADSGDIIDQVVVPIMADETASGLYARLVAIACDQLRNIAKDLITGTLQRQPQDDTKASVWRKRGKSDGQIDWRMPAKGIRNLVRALSEPYPGAHCVFDGQEIKLWDVETTAAMQDIEPGYVLYNDGTTVTIKAGIDAVRVIRHEFTVLPLQGTYLP